MNKSWICLVCLVAGTLVLFAGCSKPDPVPAAAQRLVGTWKGKAPMEGEVGGGKSSQKVQNMVDVGCEFKKDGTVTMDVLFDVSGTWEVVKTEGNALTVKMVMQVPDFSSESKMDDGKVTESTKVATTKETKNFLIVFETDDRITMAPEDEPQDKATMERQKK